MTFDDLRAQRAALCAEFDAMPRVTIRSLKVGDLLASEDGRMWACTRVTRSSAHIWPAFYDGSVNLGGKHLARIEKFVGADGVYRLLTADFLARYRALCDAEQAAWDATAVE